MMVQSLSQAGFPPEGTVFPVSTHHLRVAEGSHPWVLENEAGIVANWESETAANPHLFNGRMVFQRSITFGDGHIEGLAHMAPFASFLHWRRLGRVAGGHHLFAMPMIVSADDAVIAIRMAETTANPGRVYSPAGSLDASDIVDGLCDIEGNIRRETLEETGLRLDEMESEPLWRAFHEINCVSMFRVFRSPLTEGEIRERVMQHIAVDPEPEISELIGIRSPDPHAHNYSAFMPPVLDWIFREGMK